MKTKPNNSDWQERFKYFCNKEQTEILVHPKEIKDFISSELQRERENCKCSDCSPEDEHVCPNDRSTTRISRPCGGCGKHQTIAGALIKSQEWQDWCKYAWENKLFDTDETDTVDAMSDEHFSSFMDFIRQREREKVLEEVREIIGNTNWISGTHFVVNGKQEKMIVKSELLSKINSLIKK